MAITQRREEIIYISNTVATSGDNTIISTTSNGQSIYICGLLIQNESATATTVIVKDNASTKMRLLCVQLKQKDVF